MPSQKVYVTKVDWWLGGIVLASLMLLLGVMISLGIMTGKWLEAAVLLIPVLAVSVFAWPMTYTLSDTHLVVRSGLIRWTIA